MQPAMHSWSFRQRFKDDDSFTVFRMLDETAEMGFHSIEIMSGKANMPPGDFASDDVGYLGKVLDHARSVGVTVHCFSTYNDFAYVTDEDWRLANIAYIQKWLRLAGELGVPNIRMLTGYYIDGESREKLEQLTLEGIRQCVPVAEKEGINMAVENHNSIFFTADEMLRMMDEIGSDRLTACPDPSNWGKKAFWEGDADAKQLVLEDAAKMASKATNAHLKIRGVNADGTLMGFGKDLDTLLTIYRDAGYDGPIHFEAIPPEGDLLAPLPQARQILQDAVDRVCGQA
jgi:sugar phosphate isomerase/epimerase